MRVLPSKFFTVTITVLRPRRFKRYSGGVSGDRCGVYQHARVGALCTGTTVAGLYVYPRLDPTLNVYTVANV